MQMLEAPAGRGKIAMLVISPTRELAAQIAEEAKQLTKHQNLGVQVQAAHQLTLNTCVWHVYGHISYTLVFLSLSEPQAFCREVNTCTAADMAGDVWWHEYEP